MFLTFALQIKDDHLKLMKGHMSGTSGTTRIVPSAPLCLDQRRLMATTLIRITMVRKGRANAPASPRHNCPSPNPRHRQRQPPARPRQRQRHRTCTSHATPANRLTKTRNSQTISKSRQAPHTRTTLRLTTTFKLPQPAKRQDSKTSGRLACSTDNYDIKRVPTSI